LLRSAFRLDLHFVPNQHVEILLAFRWCYAFKLWSETFTVGNEAKLVEAVDDVEHRTLPPLVEVGRLEERRFGHAKLLCGVVEVLDVAHRDEAASRLRFEGRRRFAGKRVQLIDELAKNDSIFKIIVNFLAIQFRDISARRCP